MPSSRANIWFQGSPSRQRGCFQPVFQSFFPAQSHSCLRAHQSSAHHPQVGQRKQRAKLRGVLLQPAVAHFDVTELALDHTERMLDFGPDASLEALKLIGELIYRSGLTNCLRLPGRIAMFQRTESFASGRLATPW